MQILDNIKKELKAFEEKRAEMVKTLQVEFPKLLTPLFEKSKLIESVGWRQYTPYFNDGDECIFGVRQDDLQVNGEEQDEMPWYDWRYFSDRYKKELDGNTEINPEEMQVVKEFSEVLQSIPEDFYKDLFGDHVEVTVHRDGRIDVEEYDHD